VFDVTAPATFNNLRGWHADCQKFTSPDCAFVMVGNKSDDKSEVSEAEGSATIMSPITSDLPDALRSSSALPRTQNQGLHYH
jgi:hypothetical protein